MSAARTRLGIGTILSLMRMAGESTAISKTAGVEAALPAHHRICGRLWKTRTFENLWDTWKDVTIGDILKWGSSRERHMMRGYLIGNQNPTEADFAAAFPPHAVDWAAVAAPPTQAVQAVWGGHSTVLTQMEGFTWLTDPVFSQRASPVQWAGPKRVTPPAFLASTPQLPTLDFVLISHNHYDHLDRASVLDLYQRYGDDLRWYVPLGLRPWFTQHKIHNVVELDWWEEVSHASHDGQREIKIAFTPAQHATLRGGFGPNAGKRQTLWGGFAVVGDNLRFWFAGDTGYCTVFEEIGKRLGPFDLAAIPTGAYLPRWFMRPQHVDPEEAVRIHRDVRSRRSMAIHLGTFPLTDEAMDEPVELLVKEASAAGLAPDEFVTLRHGGSIITAGGIDFEPPIVLLPKGELV